MARKYTADEFRQIADAFELRGVVARIHNGIGEREIFARDIVAMLRQAADELEREKRYEYGVFESYGVDEYDSLEHARRVAGKNARVVRRSVGEWEEVE